jgi:hypothetical protein
MNHGNKCTKGGKFKDRKRRNPNETRNTNGFMVELKTKIQIVRYKKKTVTGRIIY